jgi:hypothetical protein
VAEGCVTENSGRLPPPNQDPRNSRTAAAELSMTLANWEVLSWDVVKNSRSPDDTHVVVDLRSTVSIDHDVLEILEDFQRSAEGRNIFVERIESESRRRGVLRVA